MRRWLSQNALRLVMALGLAVAAGGMPAFAAEAAEAHAAAGDHAKAHEEGVPLSFKGDLALWSGVTFVLFLGLLTRFAWKPLIEGLNRRESKIREDIDRAEQGRVKAEQMLAAHAKKLAAVQDEVREILAEARRDADHVKQGIVAEAQKEAEASKERALHEIGRARDTALKDLFDVMSTEVARATEHVLGRVVDGADQDRLIQEALAELPRQAPPSRN